MHDQLAIGPSFKRWLIYLFAVLLCLTVPKEDAALAQEGDSVRADSVRAESVSEAYPKLSIRKWSGKINVPDPVSVTVDDHGRVYATQTRRRKIQDLDIRQHKEWIPSDLGLQSVDDKREFLKFKLAIGGDQKRQKKHVRDINEDGQHDWRDLTVVSEAIYRLEDVDGDGTADQIATFAEDFKSEVTGIAAGVLAEGNDVFATVAPDVWKLTDSDRDGIADGREKVATGFGLHIAYAGHDMHGLIVGPDGKLYWSIGDKGIAVTDHTGKKWSYPHEGGVMRCNLDGSDFEVFAHGLRNVQEIAFDQYGNMFGVDNDADQPGERERFVYIANKMDAGWRCYYQYRGSDYNPWTREKLWQLSGEEHPAYIVPPLSHYIDGPAGFAFNPGTALVPKYKDYFFLTGAPNGTQHAFRVEPEGDGFKMVDEHQIASGVAIVGIAFGPEGAIYGADWDGGYPLDEKGSVVRIDAAEIAAETKALREAVAKQLADGVDDLENAELVKLLGHADMRIRLKAQFELVARQESKPLASTVLDEGKSEIARLHAIWGMGQLGRAGDYLARDTLGLVLKDSSHWVRGQAVKTLGELPQVYVESLMPLLGDPEPYVRTLAALAISRHPDDKPVEALLKHADRLKVDEPYWRHGLVSALAACAKPEVLAEAHTHENEQRRLVCALALRRQRDPAVKEFLADDSKWIATEAARAIHDDESIEAALSALAEKLDGNMVLPEAYFVRALNANYRIGNADCLDRIVGFIQISKDDSQRVEALKSLVTFASPSSIDRVDGRVRPNANQTWERSVPAETIQHLARTLVTNTNPALVENALDLLETVDETWGTLGFEQLAAIVGNEELGGRTRAKALRTIKIFYDSILEKAKSIEEPEVQMELLKMGTGKQAASSHVERLVNVIREKGKIGSRQAAIRSLIVEMASVEALSDFAAIVKLAEEFDSLPDADGLRLDFAFASQVMLSSDRVTKALVSMSEGEKLLGRFRIAVKAIWPNSEAPLEWKEADWQQLCMSGGDIKKGQKLFATHVEAQCVRCHRVGDEGSDIGPALQGIGAKRDAAHLLRAIVFPSADIDAKYRSSLVLLDSDEVVKGIVVEEGDEVTKVANSQGEIREIATDEIVDVSEQKTSLMPEMREILNPLQIRDLVAYLRSLK
ncbi:MAG: PVC-type heme-binding CxxCH protein [Aureliella sp.]